MPRAPNDKRSTHATPKADRSTLRTPRSTWDTHATDRSIILASKGWDKPRRRRSAAISVRGPPGSPGAHPPVPLPVCKVSQSTSVLARYWSRLSR
jgi:hypothetical protein